MINDQLLCDWLSAVVDELSVPYTVGPRIPEFGRADVLGVVTPTAGPGLVLEGINTVVGFQVRWVAREKSYAKLKLSAWQTHKALLFAPFPGSLWGTWVTSITTAGSDPTPELGDGQDLDRVAFTCTYLAEVQL